MAQLLQKDYDSQDVAPEQEAQNKSADIFAITEQSTKYRKTHIEYDKLERANKPQCSTKITTFLSSNAKAVLSVLVQKLRGKNKVFIANHAYFSTITGRSKRQNLNIINELRNYLDIEFFPKYEHKGKIHRNCYVVKKLEDKTESVKKTSPSESFIPLEEPSVEAAPIENNSSKRTRSKSEFSKYSNQFSEKKDIPQCMEKITEEQLIEACRMSGTNLNKHAAKEIMAYLGRLKKAYFCSMRQFMTYLAKCLAHEKRNPVRCNLLNFKIMKLRTEEQKQEVVTFNKCDKYLKKTENEAIFARSDETQYRARIAGNLPMFLAYDILYNMTRIHKTEQTLEIWLDKPVEVPENQLRNLLNHAKSIGGYMGVDKLEFVVNKKSSILEKRDKQTTETSQYNILQGIWGKVAKSFIEEYGHDLYTHWLGDKIEAKEDTETQTICLKASSDMVKDRIEQTYLPFLSKIGMNFGVNKLEVVV